MSLVQFRIGEVFLLTVSSGTKGHIVSAYPAFVKDEDRSRQARAWNQTTSEGDCVTSEEALRKLSGAARLLTFDQVDRVMSKRANEGVFEYVPAKHPFSSKLTKELEEYYAANWDIADTAYTAVF